MQRTIRNASNTIDDVGSWHFSDIANLADDVRSWEQSGLPVTHSLAFGVTTWLIDRVADRLSNRRESDDETFTLPVEAARLKAREILNQFPQGGCMRTAD